MPEYKLPDVGEGLTEAEIVTWKVKVGDVIEINDIVVEIETAKSLVELPSPYAGTVTACSSPRARRSRSARRSSRSARRRDRARAPRRPPRTTPTSAWPRRQHRRPARSPARSTCPTPPPAVVARARRLVGRNKAERESMRRPRKVSAAAAAAQRSTHEQLRGVLRPRRDGVPRGRRGRRAGGAGLHARRRGPDRLSGTNGDVRTLAKPPVRKLAKDLGVDLTALVGSGEGGVVTREDVQAASSAGRSGDGRRRAFLDQRQANAASRSRASAR